MRQSIAVAFAAVLLAGCGSQSDDSGERPGGPPTASVDSPATLTVATSFHPGRGGSMYVEGALARLILLDADGNQVDMQTKSPGKQFVFPDLAPGAYVLEPALRPCDGNCGYLDPPTDSCRDTLRIVGDMRIKVDFTVGDPCVVAAAHVG